jgi:hypothetical protein
MLRLSAIRVPSNPYRATYPLRSTTYTNASSGERSTSDIGAFAFITSVAVSVSGAGKSGIVVVTTVVSTAIESGGLVSEDEVPSPPHATIASDVATTRDVVMDSFLVFMWCMPALDELLHQYAGELVPFHTDETLLHDCHNEVTVLAKD